MPDIIKAQETSPVFCKDCVWYRHYPYAQMGSWAHACEREVISVCHVTGERHHSRDSLDAFDAREDENLCGPSGRWFMPKDIQ